MNHLKYGTRVKLLTLKDNEGKPLMGTVVAWNKHYDGLTASDHYDYNVLVDSYAPSDPETPFPPSRYEWVTLKQMEITEELADLTGQMLHLIDDYARAVMDYNKGGGLPAQMDRVHTSDALSAFALANRHRIKVLDR